MSSPPGTNRWSLPLATIEQMIADDDGICRACAHVQGNVEPDARQYPCESCRQLQVYGTEEALAMGWLEPTP